MASGSRTKKRKSSENATDSTTKAQLHPAISPGKIQSHLADTTAKAQPRHTAAKPLDGTRTSLPVDNSKKPVSARRQLQTSKIIILLLIIVGFIYRIFSLSSQSIWIDESFSILAVKAILQHGISVIPSGAWYAKTTPVMFYVIALFAKVFSPTLFWFRFASVLIGTAFIPVTYIVARRLFNNRVALFSASIVTFSFWEIAWSRQVRHYILLQLLYLLSLYFFYRSVEDKDRRSMYACAATTILTMLTHPFGYALIPVYLAYAMLHIRKVISLLKNKAFLISAGILALATIAVLTQITTALFAWQSWSWQSWSYFNNYLFYLKGNILLFFFLAIAGLMIGLKKYRSASLLIALAFIIPLYALSFHVSLIHYRYLFFIFPILIMLTSVVFDYLISLVPYRRVKLLAWLVIITLLFFTPYLVKAPQAFYSLEYQTPQPDFAAAYNYVDQHSSPSDVIISAWPAVSDFYLGHSDYWLKFDMTGGLDHNITGDRYLSIPMLSTAYNLTSVMQNNTGWIIVDRLAINRINSEMVSVIENQSLELKLERDMHSAVYVYSFDHR